MIREKSDERREKYAWEGVSRDDESGLRIGDTEYTTEFRQDGTDERDSHDADKRTGEHRLEGGGRPRDFDTLL
ncbi:hypothetical protein JCM31271_36380 [Halorubrum trueperi]